MISKLLRSPLKPPKLITVIFVLGISYLFLLQGLVPEGAYFNGDAGLKAMLTQDIAAGRRGFDLNLPDIPWIRTLWGEEMSPYREPFFYRLGEKYYITFPYTFSLVTAPFLNLNGSRGLYIIPCLATLVIWWIFYRLCKKLDLSTAAISSGLFLLIFASHLSLYSAMYLELTLATCLALSGIYFIFPKKDSDNISYKGAIGAGVFSGLAVWFRPEQIFLVLFLDLMSVISLLKPIRSTLTNKLPDWRIVDNIGRMGWVYLATSILTLLMYGMTNWLIYRNFFGVHAIQVLEGQGLSARIDSAVENFQLMTVGNHSLVAFLPISIFSILYLLASRIKIGNIKYEQDSTPWYIFCGLYLIGVAILVPTGAGGKQWGPRFLLLLAPVISLLFAQQLDRLLKDQIHPLKGVSKIVVFAVIAILGGIGIIQNPIRGSDFLIETYRPSKQVVEKLRALPQPVVAISNQYLSHSFQPIVDRDVIFFLVRDEFRLGKLAEALNAQNLNSFTYICYSYECDLFNPDAARKRIKGDLSEYDLQVFDAETYGRYRILNIGVRMVPYQ